MPDASASTQQRPAESGTILIWSGAGWSRMEAQGRRCRYVIDGQNHSCKQPATWALLRAGRAGDNRRWWGYCDAHLYGRVEVEGELWSPVALEESGWREFLP